MALANKPMGLMGLVASEIAFRPVKPACSLVDGSSKINKPLTDFTPREGQLH